MDPQNDPQKDQSAQQDPTSQDNYNPQAGDNSAAQQSGQTQGQDQNAAAQPADQSAAAQQQPQSDGQAATGQAPQPAQPQAQQPIQQDPSQPQAQPQQPMGQPQAYPQQPMNQGAPQAQSYPQAQGAPMPQGQMPPQGMPQGQGMGMQGAMGPGMYGAQGQGMQGGGYPGGQMSGAQQPEDTTPANFQLGAKLPAELKVPVPKHELNFDEKHFIRLLAGSISLSKDEKKRIIESIPKLRQEQIDELIRIFEEEKQKFAALSKKHVPQLEKLAQQHYNDWMSLEDDYAQQSKSSEDESQADEIRKNLGI